MDTRKNKSLNLIMIVLGWLITSFLLAFLLLVVISGHGAHTIIAFYIAPVFSLVGATTHIVFVLYQKKNKVIIKFEWFWIGLVTVIILMVLGWLLSAIFGVDPEIRDFFLNVTLRLGIIPASLIPLLLSFNINRRAKYD